MLGTGGLEQVVALLRETNGQNTRLGRMFVLMGAVAFVGGALLFALTGALQLTAEEQWTLRVGAGILVGGALPALFHGLVLLADTARSIEDTSEIGILLCVLGAGILLSTGAEVPAYAGLVLLAYGGGISLCASAVSRLLAAGDEAIVSGDRISGADAEPVTPDDRTTVRREEPPAN